MAEATSGMLVILSCPVFPEYVPSKQGIVFHCPQILFQKTRCNSDVFVPLMPFSFGNIGDSI